MSNVFDTIRVRKQPRSNFDLSHEAKLSTELGRLTPILCAEVVPGDSFRLQTEIFCRLAPMLAPIMHRVNVYTHFFYVPKRLLWKHWERFIATPHPNESQRQKIQYPRIDISNMSEQEQNTLFATGSLADYLGFPVRDKLNPGTAYRDPVLIDLLPFKAYQLIYNEYYRDQNLTPAVQIGVDQTGDVNPNTVLRDDWEDWKNPVKDLLKLRNRCWEKDYFTTALKDAQKGEDVFLKVSGQGNVVFDDTNMGTGTTAPQFLQKGQGPNDSGASGTISQVGHAGGIQAGGSNQPYVGYDPKGTLKVDMKDVNLQSIPELRRMFRLQEWLELINRTGSRYKEMLLAFFGVKTSDKRLDRPEYLGGGRTPVVISEVLQQADGTADMTPLGDMAGHGISSGVSHRFNAYFEEHGYVIGILSITPRSAYQQGMPRMFSKFDPLDYYWPQFARIGDQEVKNQEIYFDPTDNLNDGTFGYAPRYSEYKYIPSRVNGDFRNTLDYWHLGRIFASRPQLNSDFVTIGDEQLGEGESGNNKGLNRIFAVTDQKYDHFWLQVYHNLQAKRPMPYYGDPSF